MRPWPRRPILLLRCRNNQPGRNWYIEARFAMSAEENISLARDTIALGARIMISAKSAWTHPKRRPLIHYPTKWMQSCLHRRDLLFFNRILSYIPRTLLRTTEKLSVYAVGTHWMRTHQDSRQRLSTSALYVLIASSAKYVRKTGPRTGSRRRLRCTNTYYLTHPRTKCIGRKSRILRRLQYCTPPTHPTAMNWNRR